MHTHTHTHTHTQLHFFLLPSFYLFFNHTQTHTHTHAHTFADEHKQTQYNDKRHADVSVYFDSLVPVFTSMCHSGVLNFSL